MQGSKKPIQWERSEQEALIEWHKLVYPKELLFTIPNQLIRSCVQARTMARSGLMGGIPDLMLAVANQSHHGLFIELKRKPQKGCPKGVVTEKQKAIMSHLSSRGYKCVVCYGWVAAKNAIEEYMKD